jgi:hypothetical protein
MRDTERSLLALGAGGPVPTGDEDPDDGPELPRRYLLARGRGFSELACLPVPWTTETGSRVVIETLVRRSPLPGEAVLAMSPRDPKMGPALGYMAAGSLGSAQLLFDHAQDLLYGKLVNPLAATAGGYVLMAIEAGASAAQWKDWVPNLAGWFPWLPDGTIQLGRLLLRHRRGPDDVAQARAALFEAYDRGLPFYSLGLQWLVEGLSWFAAEDAEAARRLANVREIAWRANLQQPFTTIRLGPR